MTRPTRNYVYIEHGQPAFDAAFFHMLADAIRRQLEEKRTLAQAIYAQTANTSPTAKGQTQP